MTIPGRGMLVDSGYFIALFDPRDDRHKEAVAKQKHLKELAVVLPWPILYETLNTRIARRPDRVRRLQGIISKSMLLDDLPYRCRALHAIHEQAESRPGVSLVDAVLMELIKDSNLRIRAMLTFNYRDFRSICAEHEIEYLCEPSAPGSRA